MDLIFFNTELPTYLQIIIPVTIIIIMWLPFYKRLDFMARILILVFIIIPASILIGFKGILILISILIRTFTLLIKADKTIVSNYTCEKCGFIKELEQSLKLFKCSQCGHENLIEQP